MSERKAMRYPQCLLIYSLKIREVSVLKRSRVSTDRESIKHYFSLLKDKEPIKAVMEATFNWVYFYDEISPFGDEAILAHPLKQGQ